MLAAIQSLLFYHVPVDTAGSRVVSNILQQLQPGTWIIKCVPQRIYVLLFSDTNLAM